VKGSMQPNVQGENRFENDAIRYAAYLETPEGRLREDLAFANLQDFLPTLSGTKSLYALDLGCGPGTIAVRMARLGFHVTLFDSSLAMLEIAQRAVREADVSNRTTAQYGDAAQLASLFTAKSFDVILCHNLLEYVDDPGAVLSGAAALLRDSSSILSVLVRSQAGEALKAAIQTGDLAAAENALSSEWVKESLYGGELRLFTLDKMRDMLKKTLFRMIVERGVRTVADYLPPKVSRTEEYPQIFELERKLSQRTEFTAPARYMHFLAMGLAH